jgi:hypothetical protein
MNNDWKPEKNISSPWDVDVQENNIGQPIRDFAGYQLIIPKLSNWTCYLFGGSPGNGIQYTPIEGKVPNRFVRWMMKLCFACTWVKNNETQS